MESTNIPPVKPPFTASGSDNRRDERLQRVIQARRHVNSPSAGGRAWINGREVGGHNPRYAHLGRNYD